jgi:uncharacterized protein (DUF58 family)
LTALPPVTQAESLAAGLPKLLLAAERLAFAAAPGLHGRRRAGPGEAFWQFRDWREGDDRRRIDWRRSAMGERLYLRDRERDAQASFTLALQDTPGMAFQSSKSLPTKHDRAALLLLALACLLLRAGERVALAGKTPPRAGIAALPAIAQSLATPSIAATDAKARRIIFGDFLESNPHFIAPEGGAVVQILDPAECDFPFTGRIKFVGFAAEPALEATSAATWRTTYLARITAQREAVAQAAARAGQTPLFHRTDAPPATALAALHHALHRALHHT